MKKFVWPLVGLMLVAYVVWLSAYFQVVETVLIFLVPLFLCALLGAVVYLFIRLFGGRVAYAKVLTVSALVSLVVQGGLLGMTLLAAAPKTYPKEVVVRDIDALVKTMEEVHPDLYNRIPRERYYRQVDSLKATLPEQVSREHTAKALCQMTAWIEDGHTRLEGEWMNSLPLAFRKVMPYKFRVIEDRLYVADTYGWYGHIPPGSEVIEINGLPAADCLAQVSGLFSWETVAWRNVKLEEVRIWSLWNDFRSFTIRYRTPEGKVKTVRNSAGLIDKILVDLRQSRMNVSQGKRYSYKTLSPGVGYLEFYESYDREGFSAFLDTTFRKVQQENITHLIVDIRKHGGGNSLLCEDLMQYISQTPFRLSESVVRKMSAQAWERFSGTIDSADYKIGELYTQSSGLRQLAENPLRFGGKVYMLMGGRTFSSGTMLAAGFQCYGVGTTIGSETGGATASFGDIYYYTLPETGYKFSISNSDWVMACGKHDRHGVIPDHVVIPTIEDELAGRDPVLDFTLELIRQGK